MKMRKGTTALVTLLGTLIAAYTLFPFLLVVINTMKANSNIVADPVGFSGANFSTMMENLNKVINNSNFVFWNAFGTSAIITVISLVLLAVLGGMVGCGVSIFYGYRNLEGMNGDISGYAITVGEVWAVATLVLMGGLL